MTNTLRWPTLRLAAVLVVVVARQASGGAFIGSDSIDPAVIMHPTGYTGTGGTLNVSVCVDPTSVNASAMEIPVQNAIKAWNELTTATPNLIFAGANDIPSTDFDFESAALHEMGHCIGLHHPNLSTESGLSDPQRNYTKTLVGVNTVYDLNDGADNIIGSSDDIRGDDVNLHWFRKSNNNPYTIAGTVDSTTYSRLLGDLPGGNSFVANADRDVGALLGFPDTEAVMQQGQGQDEAQRQLTNDDVATVRYGMTGLDETAATGDDYTINLTYGGLATGCDINVDFDNAQAAFAACALSASSITATHWRVATANMYFNTGFSWYFNPLFTGSTTSTTTTTPTTTTTSTTLIAPIGHLKCYKTKDTRVKVNYTLDLIAGVAGLTNEFGCTLKLGSKQICVEVDKQNVVPTPPGSGVVVGPNAGAVYLSYKLKCPKQTVAPIALADQFGAGTFTVGTASSLLVPALPGPALDHLKCYKTKDVRPKVTYTMDLMAGVGGFTNEFGCTVKLGAKKFCVQVNKQNVVPAPPGGGPGPGPGSGAALISYKLKCPKQTLAPVGATDQFGAGTFTPKTAATLLVPAAP